MPTNGLVSKKVNLKVRHLTNFSKTIADEENPISAVNLSSTWKKQ